jgi:hypothetical protein
MFRTTMRHSSAPGQPLFTTAHRRIVKAMTARTRLAALVVSALLTSSCGEDGQARSSPSPATDASTSASTDVVLPTEHYVDVGESKMYMLCWNEPVPDEPSILLMSGADLLTSSWENMAYALAPEGHHICAYDRLGVGNSDPPAEASRTAADQVDELVGLLDAADLEQPVVIAAHSIAGLLAVALVDQAPERVAGVVLVDPLPPRLSIVQRAALPPKKRHESQVLTEERRFLNGYLNDPAQNSEPLCSEPTTSTWRVCWTNPGQSSATSRSSCSNSPADHPSKVCRGTTTGQPSRPSTTAWTSTPPSRRAAVWSMSATLAT